MGGTAGCRFEARGTDDYKFGILTTLSFDKYHQSLFNSCDLFIHIFEGCVTRTIGQSVDCHSASGVTLEDMGKIWSSFPNLKQNIETTVKSASVYITVTS